MQVEINKDIKKGVPWNKGISPSEDVVKRMVDTRRRNGNYVAWNKGKKGIQVAWNKGIPHSDTTKHKISIANKGKSAWNKANTKQQISKEKHWNRQGGKTKQVKYCIDCGKEIKRFSTRCFPCRLKFSRGKNAAHWQNAKIETQCNNCKKTIIRYKFEFEDRKKLFCSKECADKYYCGSNAPLWRGGISFEPYPLGWNRTFKEQIRYRDGYKCRLCGIPEIECNTKLHIHHIDYDKKNVNYQNLISLCFKCHPKTNTDRNYWEEYFNKTLVKEKQCLKF